jgi:hypothetical protein
MHPSDEKAQMNYAEFVQTTFAYAHKSFSLDPFQSIDGDHTTAVTQYRELGGAYQTQLDELCLRADKLHVGLAIAGEILELTNEIDQWFGHGEQQKCPYLQASQKEIGDLCYYIQMLFNLYGFDVNIPDILPVEEAAPNRLAVTKYGETLVDYIKRVEVYGQVYDSIALHEHILNFLEALMSLCPMLSTTQQDIVGQNILKLQTRYASGSFSTQESQAKADSKSE